MAGAATIVVAAMVASISFGGSDVGASPPARTEGAARAAFEAGWTGGLTVLLRTPGQGVPRNIVTFENPEDLRLYPFADGAQYCASGWHVVTYNNGDLLELYDSRQALVDYLNSVEMRYELDGISLVTERTAIKSMPPDTSLAMFEVVGLLWFSMGTLLPPGSLTVGTHDLTTTVIDPVYGDFQESIQFTVLPC